MEISTLVLLLTALFTVWYYFFRRSARKLWAAAQLLPGPKTLPIIGNALIFWGDKRTRFAKILQLRENFGDVICIWLGNQLLVILSGPEDIKSVFVNPRLINRDPIIKFLLKPVSGDVLFSSADKEWKIRRKMMSPAFQYNVLESYVEIFGAKAKVLVEKLNEVADGKTFDVNNKIRLCTLDAAFETLVGVESNAQNVGRSDLLEAYYTILNLVTKRILYPWQLIYLLYPFTTDGRKVRAAKKTILANYGDIIPRKLAAYRRGERRAGILTGSGKIVPSFLDTLIDESQGSFFTEKELLHEVASMAAGGLLTLSHTMSTILILIAIHPECQDALFTEMAEVFADDMTRPATNQDLSKMPVLDRVIKETLRMFPVVSFILREISEDVVLPSCYTLPAGSLAVIPVYFLHRDSKNFPEPNKFLPNRWLPGSGSTDHNFAYTPFGGGPRNCLGKKYSFLQMKSTLCQLVRKFKISTDFTMKDLENLEMEPILMLESGGYQLKLEKRDLQTVPHCAFFG